MKPPQKNSNEFELYSNSPRPFTVPHIQVKRRPPEGVIPFINAPNVSPYQMRKIIQSMKEREGPQDV